VTGRRVRPGSARHPDAGLGLTDVLVGMTLLAMAVISLTNLFITAMSQGKNSGVYGEAATWAQGELDYLRAVGFTSSCLIQGTTTITPTSSGCTALQPALPVDFAQATVQVEDNALGQTGLKRVTIQMYHPTGTLFYRVVTYVTQFS
jgi:Tfp pilus assembly protein PilV